MNAVAPATPSTRGTLASSHLDLVRGLAAIAVLVYHVRYRFFVDYSEVVDPSWGDALFYTATSFGHDAVIVFFVLSGYFIGGSVRAARRRGGWTLGSYTRKRIVRLGVVLVPGLALTLAWDAAGLRWFGDHPVYTGAATAWAHDYFSVAERLTAAGFVGNLGFTQGVLVRPLGSNDPLWSLSYEFWYYAAAAAITIAVGSRRSGRRLAAAATLLAIGLFVGPMITAYFGLWLLGAAVAAAPSWPALSGRRLGVAIGVAGLAFAAATVAGHVGAIKRALGGSLLAADTLTAVGFATLLYALLHDRRPAGVGVYSRLASGLAAVSFTLYVVHMPLLVFLRAGLTAPRPWDPGPGSIAVALAITLVAVAYAVAVWCGTERHTPRVQQKLAGWLTPRAAGEPSAAPSVGAALSARTATSARPAPSLQEARG